MDKRNQLKPGDYCMDRIGRFALYRRVTGPAALEELRGDKPENASKYYSDKYQERYFIREYSALEGCDLHFIDGQTGTRDIIYNAFSKIVDSLYKK